MPALFRCAQGHLWEDLFEPSLVDGAARCPRCGQASRPEGAVTEPEVMAELTPGEMPGAAGATRVVPRLGQAPARQAPDGPATAFHPQLANMTPAELPEDEGEVAPILPSRRLAEKGAAPPAPRRADWPDVPGYELEAELGRGGMGVVYKARQSSLNRVVALKMILSGSQADERDRARFHHEAQAVARLSHPNIVQIFEVGEHNGQAYFSLEFVEGGSLADLLKGQEIPVAEAARLIQVLAEAMHFAHQHGIVHRDLKPANILLTGGADKAEPAGLSSRSGKLPLPRPPSGTGSLPSLEGRSAGRFGMPKITDFGLAKSLDDDTHNTRSGMVVGTPGYMAPEQATGTGVIGPASDIYALGVLLFQLVTGRLPFTGDTPMDVLIKVTQQEPPPPSRFVPRLARDLETIILKCLEKAPARRYQSALDLAEDLRRFLAHEPILARPLAAWQRAGRWARRHPALASLIAGLALAVLSVGASVAAAARAEERRVGRMRDELEAVVDRARAAAANAAWADVRNLLAEPRGRAGEEPALAELAVEVESLARQADVQLVARARFRAFQQATDDALFQASLATTGGTAAQWALTRHKAARALGLVGASAAAPPRLDDVAFTDEEKAEARRGCYELLLYLAEAAAVARPAEAADPLAILDTAAALGVQTHAYHLRRARYLEQAGRRGEAARERALAARRPPATDLDHYLVGSEYLREGQVEMAYRAFLTARRLKPDHFWVKYSLARLQVMRGQLEAARDNLTSCLGRSQVVWIYLLRGLAQGQIRGAEAEAEADFQKALDMLKEQPDEGALYALYNNRAIVRLKRGLHEPACDDLRRAVALAPARHQAYLTLAQAHRERKDTAAALAALSRGVEVAAAARARGEIDGGVLYHLYRTRAQLYLAARGERAAERALADLDSILRLPGLPAGLRAGAWRDRGHQLFRAGRVGQALEAYDRALRLRGDDPALHRWRAEALLKQRRYQGAVAAYDRYLALVPRDRRGPDAKELAKVYRSRAVALLQLGEHERALTDYNLALAQAPGDAALWLQRGQTYLACKAWALAAKDFQEALRHDAGLAAAQLGLGTARLQLGQAAEAADDALRAARLAGKDGKLIYGAACLLAQAGGQLGGRRDAIGRGPRPESGPGRRHLDAALGLLGQAVEALPAAERETFWREVVRKEAALRPLWPLAGYARLDRLHGAELKKS